MTNKNIISVLALFIILFIAVGAASATSDDVIVNDCTDNNGLTDVVSKDDPVNGTFMDLQNEVNDASGTLELNRDYVYNESLDTVLIKGIDINKSLVINGNNHIIDGAGLAHIFNIPNSIELTINNLTIVNANGSSGYYGDLHLEAGVVYIYNPSNFTFNNVRFENIISRAILSVGDLNITANNLSFVNCYSENLGSDDVDGGAIMCDNKVYLYGNDILFANCKVGSPGPGSRTGAAIWANELLEILADNLEFNNCSSCGNIAPGGAIYCNGGNVTISGENITFKDCSSNEYGGAIYNGNASITIQGKNIVFNHCSAPNAGAIMSFGNIVIISNVTFINCFATITGGAIRIQELNGIPGNLTLTDCKFINNSATYIGGAINGDTGSILNIIRCEFDGNFVTATYGGGAIYSECECSISNSKFENNTANKGGAIWNNGTLTITNSKFENNTANKGGAIYFIGNSNLNVTDCEFIGNNATFAGGAIYSESKATITDSTFTGNKANGAKTFGGAIYLAGAESSIDNCDFISNAAATSWIDNDDTYGGGSIYINGNGCNVTNSRFRDYTGYLRNGGGITVNASNVKVSNCNFTNLSASMCAGGVLATANADGFELRNSIFRNITGNNGGAVVVKEDSIIDNCTFDNCAACIGNAILAGKAYHGSEINPFSVTINDCTFINCHNSGSGSDIGNGAIDIQIQSIVTIISGNNKFENCTVTDRSGWGTGGAAIYSLSLNLTIKGTLDIDNCSCTYEQNGKYGQGGAIVNYGVMNIEGDVSITNCTSVKSYGGAISNNRYKSDPENYPGLCVVSGSLTISNCTAPNGGGGAIYNTGTLNLTNVIIKNCEAYWGGAIFNYNVLNILDNVSVDNCEANDGGAIYNYKYVSYGYEGKISFGNVNITDCYAYNEGGVIYNYYGDLTVDGTLSISDCNATNGGAIYNYGYLTVNGDGTLSISDCNASSLAGAILNSGISTINGDLSITGCSAINTGGAIYNNYEFYVYGTLNISDCSAVDGAAIFTSVNSILNINNAVISNNIAGHDIIYAYTNSAVSIADSVIEDNTAKYGNIIYSKDANVTLDNVTFANNYAVDGIVIKAINSTEDSKLIITDCTFTNNNAYTAVSNGIANDATIKGVIVSTVAATISGNNFDENENDIIFFNKEGIADFSGEGNTVSNGDYIYNDNGTLLGVGCVLADKLIAVEKNESGETTTTLLLRGKLVTNNGDVLVYSPQDQIATVNCENQDPYYLDLNNNETDIYFAYYIVSDAAFNGSSEIYLDNMTVESANSNFDNDTGIIMVASAPDGSLAQLKKIIDTYLNSSIENGTITLSRDFAYNPASDSEITTIILNKTVTITGADLPYNVVINTTGSNIESLFTIDSAIDVNISKIDFVSNSTDGDIYLNNADANLTVTDCTSTNDKSIYLEAGNVDNMVVTVLNNDTYYITSGNYELNATVVANGLKVYTDKLRFQVGNETKTDAPTFENGVYTLNTTIPSGNQTISVNSTDESAVNFTNIKTATLATVGSIFVNNAEGTHGDTLNITVGLDNIIPGTVILHIGDYYEININTTDFVLGSDGKYYYNYTLSTLNITGDDRIPLFANLYTDDEEEPFLSSGFQSYLKLNGANPELNPITVSGNYSQIVNITVTITTGNKTGDRIVLHLIDGKNVTAYVNETGVAVFNDIELTKAGNYVTEIICSRPYGDNKFYALAKTNVTWNISKISTNVTFSPENVTGKVNETKSVVVTVKDFYNNTVKSGQINVTDTGIQLLYENGTAYEGTEYNLTEEGTVTIYFKYLSVGNYTPKFSYLNRNSTYSNTNNYIYSSANLNVNITKSVVNITINESSRSWDVPAYSNNNITGKIIDDLGNVPKGNLTITVNGENFTATINEDGTFIITFNSTTKFNQTNIPLVFKSENTSMWDDTNSSDPNVVNITVNPIVTSINVEPLNYTKSIGEEFNITGNVTSQYDYQPAPEGEVTIYIGDTKYNATLDSEGKFNIAVNRSAVGSWTNLTLYYNSSMENRWINSTTDGINVTIYSNTTINITSDVPVISKVNDTYYINGTITDLSGAGVPGTVTIKDGNTVIATNVTTDGNFTFALKNATKVTTRNYTVSFVANNSTLWNNPDDVNVSVTVNPLKVTLTITSGNQTKYVGQNATIAGSVMDENSNPVVGATINIGTSITTTTDETGNFEYNLTSEVATTLKYTVSVSVATDDVYNTTGAEENISVVFQILPTIVTVDETTRSYTGKVNSTITITGTVKDSIYNKAANGTVYLTLNGKEFSAPVDPTTGAFSLNVSCNVSGTYKNLIIDYKTNNTGRWDNSSSEKITIKIQTLTVYIISNYDLEGEDAYNGTFNRLRNYTFNVTDENGNAVLNGTLNLNLDNETLSANVTNGQATFKNVLFNDTGLFEFIVDYVGNKFYKSAFNFTDINVAKVATTVYINSSISDVNKVLNITVKDDIDNKTVIKGTIYYVTPDGQGHEINLTDGSAIVTVVANRTGEYDIAVSYYDLEEDYLYSEQDFKYNITVAGIETKFQSIVDPTNGELSGNKLLITSTVRSDEGNIIENGEIEYLIGGTRYTAGLVNGVASLEVDFQGPIMVIAKFTGEDCTQAKEVYVVEPAYDNINDELVGILA